MYYSFKSSLFPFFRCCIFPLHFHITLTSNPPSSLLRSKAHSIARLSSSKSHRPSCSLPTSPSRCSFTTLRLVIVRFFRLLQKAFGSEYFSIYVLPPFILATLYLYVVLGFYLCPLSAQCYIFTYIFFHLSTVSIETILGFPSTQ